MLGEQEVPVLDIDLEPYFRKTRIDDYGKHMLKVSKAALAAGMGVNTHCIGIRGNRLCLKYWKQRL